MRIERLNHYAELRPFLAGFGEFDIPRQSVSVDVLRDSGRIIGAVMSERVVHVGPFYLRPEYLGGAARGLLIRSALREAEGTEIHVVAMNESTEKLCERFGLEHVEGSLWIREA